MHGARPQVLANLRTAGFNRAQSNVLVRALYSYADPINGEEYREAAWDLLRYARIHLRTASDRLARETGEFRTQAHRYHLLGTDGLGPGGGRWEPTELEKDAGLTEEEYEFFIGLLGEHLNQGQRQVSPIPSSHLLPAAALVLAPTASPLRPS